MSDGLDDSPFDLGLPRDWDQLAADRLFDSVDKARVGITGPAISISRSVVYGLVALLFATMALILGLIGLVRLLDVILPWDVWFVYLILGTIFCIGGLILWSKRPRDAAG